MGRALIAGIKRLYAIVTEVMAERGILESRSEDHPSRTHRILHFWFLVWRSFTRNRCPVRATALSYTTLLALVPLLAVGASITSGLLKERGSAATQELIEKIINTVAPQLQLLSKEELGQDAVDARQEVVTRINQFIENFHSKALGLSGLLGFIVVALLLLATIETTFNDIWGVTRGRSWFHRVVQYWTAISLGPIILVFIIILSQGSEFKATHAFISRMPFIGSMVFDVVPFILISLSFALFYKLMPNTHVHWRAAFYAGVVGGSLWLLVNLFNAANMGRVINMSKLYGSLATIPVFLVGLYFSWLILLFGAQVAYSIQNRSAYLQERRAEAVSQQGRELVALRAVTEIARRFASRLRPPTVQETANALGVSSRLIQLVLAALLDARLVVELTGEYPSFAPGRPLQDITCQDVLQAIRAGAKARPQYETGREPAGAAVLAQFTKIMQAERGVAASITLQNLVEQLTSDPSDTSDL